MNIKAIVIEGTSGDVEITRTSAGAQAIRDREVVAEIGRTDRRADRYEKAAVVAGAIYGMRQRGVPAATNSMVHDVLDLIERVAGF